LAGSVRRRSSAGDRPLRAPPGVETAVQDRQARTTLSLEQARRRHRPLPVTAVDGEGSSWNGARRSHDAAELHVLCTRNVPAGKISKRADVDHDRTCRQLAAKFVDREPCKLRSFHAIETRAALIHAPQPEEIGRIGAKALKERMNECILANRGKQRTLMA